MSRKAFVLAAAVLFAGACATPSSAREPTFSVWKSWCGWLESLGIPRAAPPREGRIYFGRNVPVMPVDYSYDHLVDQP